MSSWTRWAAVPTRQLSLESLGYGRPVEDHIVMHTTYVSQLLRIPQGTLKEMLVDIGPAPGRPTGMFLAGYENDTWMFTVFGMVGHEPPGDLAGILSFAQEYCPAHVIAAVRAGEPIGEVAHHRHAVQPVAALRQVAPIPRRSAGLRRRDLQLQPHLRARNYGSRDGRSRAAGGCLRRGGTDLPRRYFRASAKPIGVAWRW